jgi:hypothetical protein
MNMIAPVVRDATDTRQGSAGDQHPEIRMLDPHYRGENLVFLVGCPRSGTTWLQRLLASHPQVRTGQESHLFNHFVGPQLYRWRRFAADWEQGGGGLGPGCYHTEESYRAVLRGYLLALLEPMVGEVPPGSIFLEKTPAHALWVAEIAELLPGARFLHLIRDPRDVSASLLAVSRTWGSQWAPKTPAAAARLWVWHVKKARVAGKGVGPDRYAEVRYEDLRSGGAGVLTRVFDFLQLPVEPAQVESWIAANRAEATNRGEGTPIPVGGIFSVRKAAAAEERDPRSLSKSRAGKPKLGLLERLQVWRVARGMARQVGYPGDLGTVLRG